MSSLVVLWLSSHYQIILLPHYELVPPLASVGYVQTISNDVARASSRLVPPPVSRVCHRSGPDLFLSLQFFSFCQKRFQGLEVELSVLAAPHAMQPCQPNLVVLHVACSRLPSFFPCISCQNTQLHFKPGPLTACSHANQTLQILFLALSFHHVCANLLMDVEGSLSLGGAGSAGTTDFSSVSSSGLSMPTSPTISLPLKKSDKSCHLLNKKGKKGITVKTGQAQPQKKEETKDHVGGNGRRLQVGRLLPGNP
jgi:hypothetical protein